MFGPWIETWDWLKDTFWPSNMIRKRSLNFITIHYLYIIGMAIIGSILMYPAGGIKYIDALFLASGGATQSGLNPVNINALNLEQQIILYVLPMLCTPIFINTFVVFVRLYWFERRFQNIVKEARSGARSRSRTRTEMKNEIADPAKLENGIRGRSIVVLHNDTGQKIGNTDLDKLKDDSASSSSQGQKNEGVEPPVVEAPRKTPTFRREITFADEVNKVESDDEKPPMLPKQLSPEQHIAFLENQRNPKDKGALRIPGPKDYDRGSEPLQLDSVEEDVDLDGQDSPTEIRENPMRPMRTRVTIDAPDHPRLTVDTSHKHTMFRHGNDNAVQTPAEETVPPSARVSRARSGTFSTVKNWGTTENEATPYLSWQPTIGRNSAFADLTEEQREELGGIEYRSLKTLAVVLVLYYILFHLLGVLCLVPWIYTSRTWGPIVENDGVTRAWWGFYTAASLFNDLGYTLTPDSMQSFQFAVFVLLLGSFLIVIGNTGFPCMLRFVIWVASLFTPRGSGVWEELRFLLDHPRRCFTLLFPTTATWWLFWILVVLNGLDVIFFIVLDLHDPAITSLNPPGYRFLNGLFQATSTRTAGFASVNLADLHPGIQVSYMIMMYISVFPIAISVRRTNVYEEKSLGIYGSSAAEDEDEKEPSYVGAHIRRQLGFDLWYIAIGLFIIAIAEGDNLANTNEYAFTLFSVLFEIVSAYGTVGLSLGYPNVDTSFSGQFSVLSKLVVIAMQIRGRHRGLPYELDRAILLPSDHLHKKEDADAAKRAVRRNSSLSHLEQQPNGHPLSSRTPTAGTVGGGAGAGGGSGRTKYGTTPSSPDAPLSFGSPVTAAASGVDHAATAPAATPDGAEMSEGHHSGQAQRGLGQIMAAAARAPKLRLRGEGGGGGEH